MAVSQSLKAAYRAMESGRRRRALRAAWRAQELAVIAKDAEALASVRDLANQMAQHASVGSDATILAGFCQSMLEGAGRGVDAPGPVERLIMSVKRPANS